MCCITFSLIILIISIALHVYDTFFYQEKVFFGGFEKGGGVICFANYGYQGGDSALCLERF